MFFLECSNAIKTSINKYKYGRQCERKRGNYENNAVSLPFLAHQRRKKKWVGPINYNLSSAFHRCSKRKK